MSKVGIIGAGAWGTAIAKNIGENGHDVLMWAFEEDVVKGINDDNENRRYLPGIRLPKAVKASTDIREAASGREFIILASPSLFLLSTIRQILTVPSIMEGEAVIGVLTKGFMLTNRGPRLIIETLEDYLPGFYKGNLVYISGPSHAEEVSRGILTGLISASQNPRNSIKIRELLNSRTLMMFSSLDVVGVQVSAALKNVIAIAFGILDALKEYSGSVGDNTESLLLAGGLNEIQQFGAAVGASHPETFTSIAAVGDLDVTCRSIHGRNRRFGREIILKDLLQKYSGIDELINDFQNIGYLPEGAVAVRAMKEIVDRQKLKMPISMGVYRILNKESKPLEESERILQTLTGASIKPGDIDFHVDLSKHL
ncbi:NAD(P)H-dependent glycerol-3-phosphate dehydrogenase [Salinispira pacifica]|uniref:Glycerol-3-phosphate dehydrogenase [NAD(P)+] n=1 Tax=Salinispira pacifica TaxID=1307761 RepID=V5WDP6_9SPIO|nr:NAD(P)H-dependent glycerol-3-phosphate dehydrogenase [Salinispira pacifica]AHC13740.1 Glycerol-3-phosphate dehydrogenase [NAD(P)+] [Salinispira pacifica]